MQLTRHTDYALRVLMFLGAEPGRKASVAQIASYFRISRNHLVKVVQGLTEHGFVSTVRGKHGGMVLARDPADITIGEVVRRMENHFNLVSCLESSSEICMVDKTCPLKNILRHATETFLQELDAITLAEVLQDDLRRQLVKVPVNF